MKWENDVCFRNSLHPHMDEKLLLSADSRAFLFSSSLIFVVVPLGWEPANSARASGASSACTSKCFRL